MFVRSYIFLTNNKKKFNHKKRNSDKKNKEKKFDRAKK